MKKLFILLIFIPLFITIKIPYTDWEWNFDLNWDFGQFIENLKTDVPIFIKNLKLDIEKFIKKNDFEKREWIRNLTKSATEIKKNINPNMTKLAELTTQAAQYMSYQICNSTNYDSYKECRENKKEVFKQLVEIVQDRFQCSKIIDIVTSNILTADPNESLKYILFLISSITKNPDAIYKGEAQAIYDLLYCLETQLDEQNLTKIIDKLPDTINPIDFKLDVNTLLIQATENLVPIIHFEELDEYIKKANKKTGLISDEKAKNIHQQIFKNLKKLNDFGSNFYNLSSTLAVNVTVRPEYGELNVSQEIVSEFEDKGIKIVLNTDKLFKMYGEAYSIQTVVFDSPLVSVKGEREKEGGTANTFVAITLYKSDGSELFIDNIHLEELRPIIFYRKDLYKAMTTCLYYNEKENVIENKGIKTETFTENEIEYIKCIPQHLTSFTIGSYKSSKESIAGKVVLSIFICLFIIGIAIGGYYFWRKRSLRENSSQMNQAFPNRDGLLS